MKKLNSTTIKRLKEYLEKSKELESREPEQLTYKEWDLIFGALKKDGNIPAEYASRVKKSDTASIVEGYEKVAQHKISYIDIEWENWNKECIALTNEYQNEISKAIALSESIEKLPGDTLDDLIIKVLNKMGEDPPQLKSVIPQKHIMPNNKLANTLTSKSDIVLNGKEFNLEVAKGKKGNAIKSSYVLSFLKDDVSLHTPHPYTEFDRCVYNAMATLFVYGDDDHIVTPAMVFRAMVHATDTETPSSQQLKAVVRSIDKMRFIGVKIDCTEEFKQRKISLNGEGIRHGTIDTYLLNADKVEVSTGKVRVMAYKMSTPPILYEYARLIKQVITIPAELLEIKGMSSNPRRIAINTFLIRNISTMKIDNDYSNRIYYERLYNEICEAEPTEKEKRSIKESTERILKSLITHKFVKNFTPVYKGRSKIGVDIII